MPERRRCWQGTAVHLMSKTWLADSPGLFFRRVRLQRAGTGMGPVRPQREGIVRAAVARATVVRRDAMVVSVVSPAQVRSTEGCRPAGTKVRAVECSTTAEDAP